MATKKELALLPAIAAAMQNSAAPYAMLSAKDVAGLVKDGLAEQNSEISDGDNLATRLTAKGLETVNTPNTAEQGSAEQGTATNEQAAPAAPRANPPAFDVASFGGFQTDVPIPTVRSRSGGGGLAGLIDTAPVGGSAFFPNTEDRPNMAKTLASTVSTVLAKHATPRVDATGAPVMENYVVKGETKTRQAIDHAKAFTVKSVTENGVEGARIWRTK